MGWQHSLKLRGKSTLDPPKQRINSQYNLNTTQIIALSQKKPHANSIWCTVWFTWYSRTDKTNTCWIKSGPCTWVCVWNGGGQCTDRKRSLGSLLRWRKHCLYLHLNNSNACEYIATFYHTAPLSPLQFIILKKYYLAVFICYATNNLNFFPNNLVLISNISKSF